MLYFIIIAGSTGIIFFIYHLTSEKCIVINDDGIVLNNKKTIHFSDIVKIETPITKHRLNTSIYFKKSDNVHELKIPVIQENYKNILDIVIKKLNDNDNKKVDANTKIILNNENFFAAKNKLENEILKEPENFNVDDVHDERLFDKIVTHISKPCDNDIRKLRYILNSNIEDPKDILLLDDVTGVFTTRLWNLGYNVTSLQYTKAALNYVEKVANEQNANPDVLVSKFDEIGFVKEHDMAVLLYPTHVYYEINEFKKMLHGIYKNIKRNGGFLLNNNFIPDMNFGYSTGSTGEFLKEPVIFVMSSSRIGHYMIYKYIEVGINSLKTAKKYNKKRIWTSNEIINIAKECGFKLINSFKDIDLILLSK